MAAKTQIAHGMSEHWQIGQKREGRTERDTEKKDTRNSQEREETVMMPTVHMGTGRTHAHRMRRREGHTGRHAKDMAKQCTDEQTTVVGEQSQK